MKFCAGHPGWKLRGNALVRRYKFKDFKEAMLFVNKVAWLAERLVHHPDVTINYNTVTLSVTTHDSGGITARDFALVEKIDEL